METLQDVDVIRKSRYAVTPEEDSRLLLQNRVLDHFDRAIYEEAFREAGSPLTVLDVGCGTGEMLLHRLEGFPVEKFLGIDKSKQRICSAAEKLGSDRVIFAEVDLEADDFELLLRTRMRENAIKSFDIIHISMVLLHLEHPDRLLEKLRGFLAEDGRIIIRDIDDGLNLAYPDPDGLFRHLFEVGFRNELSGNRYTGRKVFSLLKNAGYGGIELPKQGLSTAGWNREEKEAFYDMSFRYIVEAAGEQAAKARLDRVKQEDAEWVMEHSEAIHEQFMKEDFIASLGFMTYTALKA